MLTNRRKPECSLRNIIILVYWSGGVRMTLTKPMACEEPKRRKNTRSQENIGSRRPREERGEGGSGPQWRLGKEDKKQVGNALWIK